METARVYVGTWKKYNNGNLAGAWVDLTKCNDYADYLNICRKIHSDEEDPEFMIQSAELPDGQSVTNNDTLTEQDFNDIIQEVKDSEKEEQEVEDVIAEKNIKILEYSEKALAVIGDTYHIKDKLKNLGGKFNPRLSCGPGWIFSKKVENKLSELINGASLQKVNKLNNKELIEEYLNEMRKLWNDDSMVDYYKKEISSVYRLSNGGLIKFDKPSIKTSFCFGYSHGDDSMKQANNLASTARNNEKFFLSANLDIYDDKIKEIEKFAKGDSYKEMYIYRSGYRNGISVNVFNYVIISDFDLQRFNLNYKEIKKITEEDKNIIIESLKNERAKFEKRLNTYLKKYGLSKINSWSYWQDE